MKNASIVYTGVDVGIVLLLKCLIYCNLWVQVYRQACTNTNTSFEVLILLSYWYWSIGFNMVFVVLVLALAMVVGSEYWFRYRFGI
jgi:hypothetical protein